MSSKRQKMITKRGRAGEEPARCYDYDKVVNKDAVVKFSLISKNRSFIKEKGFHHPDDFFRKTIVSSGWGHCATSVVREFYSNLDAHALKKVRVRRVLVDFSAQSINRYYNLDPVPSKPFDRLHAQLDYS